MKHIRITFGRFDKSPQIISTRQDGIALEADATSLFFTLRPTVNKV